MAPLFVIIPLSAAFIISITGRYYKKLPDILANLVCISLAVLSFLVFYELRTLNYQPIIYKVGGWIPPVGISMVVDGLTAIMLIVINIAALMAVIFSISYNLKITHLL